ncbi:MAG: DNA polymerase III subunit gamma/tau [Pseudomarimonas sp.]
MSYLVLARKWRPRRFAELVGQTHVVRALTNALTAGRVHHAFLFTGTRGVGKTTIARIFAKSLNCETGIGAEPCGVCPVCVAVDAGRFVDLIEIDAASHTGVDDVRDLIDNAQYMPSRGRYKVYLIDEVHMLSRNAFNALLKTLEEPPEHVKFLLATTDPQKLPVTVLSRCLQFNLKRLTPEQIGGQIHSITVAEGIAADAPAIALLAHAADGSLRDGLSLLDQAIAYGAGNLREADVMAMLGTVDSASVDALIESLALGDGVALLAEVERLADFSPDFGGLLEAIAAALHRIQLAQLVPSLAATEWSIAQAKTVAPELVQLWYQMAVQGRRELELAPTPRVGFEMALLRMLAFRPRETSLGADAGSVLRRVPTTGAVAAQASARTNPEPALSASTNAPMSAVVGPAASAPPTHRIADAPITSELSPPFTTANVAVASAASEAIRPVSAGSTRTTPRISSNEDWLELVATLGLKGPVRELASNAGFVAFEDPVLRLSLAESLEYLRPPACVQQLTQALVAAMGHPLTLDIRAAVAAVDTLSARSRRDQDARQQAAEREFVTDPAVTRLLTQYEGRIVPGSIRPPDSN